MISHAICKWDLKSALVCFIYIVQILVHTHFDLVSWLLDLEATEPVSETVTQMAVGLINIYLISVHTAKEMSVKAIFFHVLNNQNKQILKRYWNVVEVLLN